MTFVRYEVINGVLTRMREICECGARPQAPEWDQCYGCGKTGYERPRHWVPAE